MTEHLRLKADLESLRAIAPWVGETMARGFQTDQIATVMPGIELAVQEIAVNIVEHGYGFVCEDATNAIELELTMHDDSVELVLIDHGPAYDPAEIAAPSHDVPQIGGYGLMIVRQLTTAFAVERDGDTNRSRLRFAIPRATTKRLETSTPAPNTPNTPNTR